MGGRRTRKKKTNQRQVYFGKTGKALLQVASVSADDSVEVSPEPVQSEGVECPGDLTRKTTRRIAGLLGFVSKSEVSQQFQQGYEMLDGSSPLKLWSQFMGNRNRLAPLRIRQARNVPASVTITKFYQQVKERRTYQKYYEEVGDYSLMIAPIEALIAPQWYADIDYIEEIVSQLSEGMTLEEQLSFAMRDDRVLTKPVIQAIPGGSIVTFIDRRPDLNADPVATVREVGQGEFEIVVHAGARPNYITVTQLGNRLILENGVHRVCALFKLGYKEVFCLFRTVGAPAEIPSQFFQNLGQMPRPPLVIDYLNPLAAALLQMRATFHLLHVSINVGGLRIPALHDAAVDSAGGTEGIDQGLARDLSSLAVNIAG